MKWVLCPRNYSAGADLGARGHAQNQARAAGRESDGKNSAAADSKNALSEKRVGLHGGRKFKIQDPTPNLIPSAWDQRSAGSVTGFELRESGSAQSDPESTAVVATTERKIASTFRNLFLLVETESSVKFKFGGKTFEQTSC